MPELVMISVGLEAVTLELLPVLSCLGSFREFGPDFSQPIKTAARQTAETRRAHDGRAATEEPREQPRNTRNTRKENQSRISFPRMLSIPRVIPFPENSRSLQASLAIASQRKGSRIRCLLAAEW